MLLVVGESTIEAAIDKASLKAEEQVKRQVEVSRRDVDTAIGDTAKQLGTGRGELVQFHSSGRSRPRCTAPRKTRIPRPRTSRSRIICTMTKSRAA